MTTETDPAAPETDPPAPTTTTDPAELTAEIEKWKNLSKKNEERAKANAKAAQELEALRQQSMTDTEKAVAQAVAEATNTTRTAVLREVGSSLVDAEVRVAVAGRPVDVEALLEGLDRTRFINDEGQPDRKAIGAWVERLAPAGEQKPPGFPDLGQGFRGQQPAGDALTDFTRFINQQLK